MGCEGRDTGRFEPRDAALMLCSVRARLVASSAARAGSTFISSSCGLDSAIEEGLVVDRDGCGMASTGL